jgi:UDP-N-acetylmuramate dehydrogenase
VSLISGFEHIVREKEPLSPLTSLRLGGVAEYFAEPTTVDELSEIVKRFTANDVPIRLIGAGSNLLISESAVQGLVIHLSAPAFCQIEVNETTMRIGGGAKLSHFVASAVREGLAGPQHLAGLPGTIGGALHSNIGFPNVDVGTWVKSVDVMKRDGERLTHRGDDVSFSYHQTSLNELVILSVEMDFEKESSEELTRQMQKLWIVRRAKRPPSDQNTAYIFKDHGGESARDLIESAGLKGTAVGEVELYDADPNYFVAKPGATVAEVRQLIDLVSTQVKEKLDIQLETAIQIW